MGRVHPHSPFVCPYPHAYPYAYPYPHHQHQAVPAPAPTFAVPAIEPPPHLVAEARASPEGREGLAAFLEKRKPRFRA